MTVQNNGKPHFDHGNRSGSSVSRLLAIVVIYKLRPEDSSTLQTLLAAAVELSADRVDLKVVVWDNTPGGQEIESLPDRIIYKAAPDNPGLAVAYNTALALAEAEGYEWLLTLDQDSVLPSTFLTRIAELTRELGPLQVIGAIVPQAVSDNRMISPFRLLFNSVPQWFPPGFVGINGTTVYPINSGAVVRVSALREIDGYDPLFPLDVSDISLFHRLQASGKQVFIAGDLLLRHQLAFLSKETRMSLDRYHAGLLDECALWDMYMGPAARLERLVRLAGRVIKDLPQSGRAEFRRRTMAELMRRIFTRRKTRIAEWRALAQLRRDRSLTL